MSRTPRVVVRIGVAIAFGVAVMAALTNGIAVSRSGGTSPDGERFGLFAGDTFHAGHALGWAVLGFLGGTVIRKLFDRFDAAGILPWSSIVLLVVVGVSVALALPDGIVTADDGGWAECEGQRRTCLLPAFDSSPEVGVSVFVGFLVGWLRPQLLTRAIKVVSRAHPSSTSALPPPNRPHEPQNVSTDQSGIGAVGSLGPVRTRVADNVDDTRTRTVRLVGRITTLAHHVEEAEK